MVSARLSPLDLEGRVVNAVTLCENLRRLPLSFTDALSLNLASVIRKKKKVDGTAIYLLLRE